MDSENPHPSARVLRSSNKKMLQKKKQPTNSENIQSNAIYVSSDDDDFVTLKEKAAGTQNAKAPKRRKLCAPPASVDLEAAGRSDKTAENNVPAAPDNTEVNKPAQKPTDKNKEKLLSPPRRDDKTSGIANLGQRQLAALKSGFLADVTIRVRGEEIKCHSLIVSFASPRLAAMLEKNKTPRLLGVDPRHFRLLLEVIYGGATCEPQEAPMLLHLGRLAHKLRVHTAVVFCTNVLARRANLGNLWEILDFADLVHDAHLKHTCFDIIRYNTYNIFTTKEFLSCSATRIEEILKDRKLHVSELDLFQACVKWSNANEVESRRKALSSSLHCIDFRKFSVQEFATYVSPTRLLSPENERDIFRSLVTGKNFLPKRFSDMP